MDIVLLDGGMGQELIARAEGPPSPMWSAAVLEQSPHLVTEVHRAFAEAGATLHTLNAYAATPERLARHTAPEDVDARFEALQQAALEAARAAGDLVLAGCLPPLGGSYHPEAAPDPAAMRAIYDRVVAIQAPHCAVMLAETMSSVREARAATEAIAAAGARPWIALSVDDADGTRLRSGEALEEGVAAAAGAGAEALLLNCSRPEAISQGLGILAETRLPFGAYANGFTNAAELAIGGTVAGMGVRTDLDPAAYAAHAMGWIERGARIVGGCCEVGPAHIAHLAGAIRAAGHRIVAPEGQARRATA